MRSAPNGGVGVGASCRADAHPLSGRAGARTIGLWRRHRVRSRVQAHSCPSKEVSERATDVQSTGACRVTSITPLAFADSDDIESGLAFRLIPAPRGVKSRCCIRICSAMVGVPHRPLLPSLPTRCALDVTWHGLALTPLAFGEDSEAAFRLIPAHPKKLRVKSLRSSCTALYPQNVRRLPRTLHHPKKLPRYQNGRRMYNQLGLAT